MESLPNKDLKSLVTKRLRAERRWGEAEPIRDKLVREARESGLSKDDAQQQAYKQLDAMFPPPPKPEPTQEPPKEAGDDANQSYQRDESESEVAPTRPRSGESTVCGLSDIPESWPSLPPNASLVVEVAWVLANRIRVIREDNDGIKVDLSKALTPAPSYATLGWLETSIRAFAKFVDVSAKASASGQDDADKVKRERLEIEEIRELLGQMRALAASK
jgi:hypothetical protein